MKGKDEITLTLRFSKKKLGLFSFITILLLILVWQWNHLAHQWRRYQQVRLTQKFVVSEKEQYQQQFPGAHLSESFFSHQESRKINDLPRDLVRILESFRVTEFISLKREPSTTTSPLSENNLNGILEHGIKEAYEFTAMVPQHCDQTLAIKLMHPMAPPLGPIRYPEKNGRKMVQPREIPPPSLPSDPPPAWRIRSQTEGIYFRTLDLISENYLLQAEFSQMGLECEIKVMIMPVSPETTLAIQQLHKSAQELNPSNTESRDPRVRPQGR